MAPGYGKVGLGKVIWVIVDGADIVWSERLAEGCC